MESVQDREGGDEENVRVLQQLGNDDLWQFRDSCNVPKLAMVKKESQIQPKREE